MSILDGLKNSFAFLTIFPVGMDRHGVAQAASYMPLFPLIGAATGLVAGAVVWLLELVLPQLVAGTIGLGVLILINGAQHVDGLLDFGDGIMFHGPPSGKLRVMRDPTTGAGGLSLGLVILATAAFSIAAIPARLIVPALIASESAAGFSMVLAASTGKSAHKGMNSIFVEAMHHKRALRLGLSCVIILAILLLSLRFDGLLVLIGAMLTALGMVVVSNRHFGGLTGDVLGATNEITRAVSLILVLVFLK
ncbi:MAG TPA: adenosylcobinamide-GDP ribazoletransferase [Candidatus Acidoferrales bacterium]|nr:adenosylcobinamide-GDP ribazoletransferase [Candidatus Acidoferrales bacterium]